jgi:DNA-binding NarL/FixJ family response regulator
LIHNTAGWNQKIARVGPSVKWCEGSVCKPKTYKNLEIFTVKIGVIDIRMPGGDGFWLAEQIRERWSRTAIIIATGVDPKSFGSRQ